MQCAVLYSGTICRPGSVARYGSAGPDSREGKLGSCPGPPQLGGGSTKNSKKLLGYLWKIKNLLETDNLE